MYFVQYSSQAIKELKKLDPPTARMLYGWIKKNLVDCTDPRKQGKALVGDKKGYWRYRVGNYRLVADINEGKIKIIIFQIGHRKDIYK